MSAYVRTEPITEWGKLGYVALGFAFGVLPIHIIATFLALGACIMLGVVDGFICELERWKD